MEFIRQYFRGKTLSRGIGVIADASPGRFVEQAYFILRLLKNGACSVDPVFSGLFSAGRQSQAIQGWVDGDYFDTVVFPDSTTMSLSEDGFDIELFNMLGGLVPPGGSFMVSYSLFSKESEIHRETKLGLDRGFPPVVTPIGFLLFIAGCGMSFKDWYFAEGGREGPEKLQGYKPIDSRSAKERAQLQLHELERFSSLSQSEEDDLMRACRVRTNQVLRELKKYLE